LIYSFVAGSPVIDWFFWLNL